MLSIWYYTTKYTFARWVYYYIPGYKIRFKFEIFLFTFIMDLHDPLGQSFLRLLILLISKKIS